MEGARMLVGTALIGGVICISGVMYTNDDNDRTRLVSRA